MGLKKCGSNETVLASNGQRYHVDTLWYDVVETTTKNTSKFLK